MVSSCAGRYLSSTFFLGYLAFLLYTTKTHINVQMKQSDPTMPTIHPIENGSDVVGNMAGDADGDIVGYDAVGNMVGDADGDMVGEEVSEVVGEVVGKEDVGLSVGYFVGKLLGDTM